MPRQMPSMGKSFSSAASQMRISQASRRGLISPLWQRGSSPNRSGSISPPPVSRSPSRKGAMPDGAGARWTAACLFDGKDIILTEGIFLFFVRIIRRNADNRFCVHWLHLLLSFSLLSIQKMLFFCNGRMVKSASTCRVYTVCGIIRMRDKNQTAEVCGQISARQQKRR